MTINTARQDPVVTVNLKLLQTFMLVAQELSFRGAAEKSHRSQSAISSQIRALEAQLGVSLLHRTTRNVELTSEGKELLEGARRAMHEVQLGLRRIQEAADMKRGSVSLACSPSVAAGPLPRILSAFQAEYPKVRISLIEYHSNDILRSVRNGEADFGIGPRTEQASADLQFEALLDDPIVALVPRKLVPDGRKTMTLRELTRLPLIMHARGTAMRQLIESVVREQALELDIRYQCMQMHSLVAMASAGLGAAILPRSAIDVPPSARVLRVTSPSLTRQIALVTVKGRTLSPAALRLASRVRELFAATSGPPKRAPRR